MILKEYGSVQAEKLFATLLTEVYYNISTKLLVNKLFIPHMNIWV